MSLADLRDILKEKTEVIEHKKKTIGLQNTKLKVAKEHEDQLNNDIEKISTIYVI